MSEEIEEALKALAGCLGIARFNEGDYPDLDRTKARTVLENFERVTMEKCAAIADGVAAHWREKGDDTREGPALAVAFQIRQRTNEYGWWTCTGVVGPGRGYAEGPCVATNSPETPECPFCGTPRPA